MARAALLCAVLAGGCGSEKKPPDPGSGTGEGSGGPRTDAAGAEPVLP